MPADLCVQNTYMLDSYPIAVRHADKAMHAISELVNWHVF